MHLSRNLFFTLSCQNMMLQFLDGIWQEYGLGLQAHCQQIATRSACAGAIAQTETFTNPRGADAGTGLQPARLDLAELDKLAEKFLMKSLAEYTHCSYNSGQTYFLTFCQWANIEAVSVIRVTVVLRCDLHGKRKAETPQ